MKVVHLLQAKGAAVVTIGPDATVADLVHRLAEHNVGAVVVSIDGSQVEGIVSERDVVRSLHDDPDTLSRTVGSIMSRLPETCTPDSQTDDLMVVMTEHRVRHLPVVDASGRLAGIVSIGDVVKNRIGELEFEREQLQNYLQQ
ncbi:MAG TPA: CBS domain-containing protein [Propionibacteriaceae bacterium]|nr:CBS domain-containing protein [Propionibacteriaceae bacterium]HEX2857772.1 CBS domain-containing protein [Propionibacteriaceae bacterium]